MSLINVTNLTFSYDGSYDPVFEHVSFQLDTDWKLGFTGRNGRGKTTFLQLLMGKYEYRGNISASVGFEYFPYPVANKNIDTYELLQNICPECMDWEILRELSLLEIDAEILYRPFATLSNGEQTKALLAALFLKENSFLLIDEPTNHLDASARQAVGNYLKRKQGFILVSHDRNLLDTCIDHILAINKTNIDIHKGNFSTWLENKELQDQFELAENEKLKKEIKRLSAAARRNADWSDKVEHSKTGSTNSGSKLDRGYVGHKAAKMMKRSKTIETRQQTTIDEKSRLLGNLESSDSLKLFPLTYHTKLLLECKDISLFYGEKAVCQHVNFAIRQGERYALTGKNGSGKSTVLKLLCGEEITHTGTFYRGSKLVISYISQDTSHLCGSLSQYAAVHGIDESLFKSLLRKLAFERSQFEKDISNFSGGQKKKVLIAGSLCQKAHLYIWDEPLNFIDVLSRIQIEKLIHSCQPTLLFVEHDNTFCRNIATNTISL